MTNKLNDKEKHELMREELKYAEQRLTELMEQKETIEERIEYWKRQTEAARTLSGRYAAQSRQTKE
jgi:hypothetical protein